VQRQSYRPLETIVVDNASTDGTRELLSKFGAAVKVFYNDTNSGFAAAQNQAARSAQGSWLLSLNPDVVLSPSFIAGAVSKGESLPCFPAGERIERNSPAALEAWRNCLR
jgi:N-acetylglucosaminyl-diphospho-decaprenol L-rhamnosyltransferase